jgi:1D-myo-inositol-tetrakisphosphate 5-kinase/inositol-polyphosphate multikinase
LQGIAHTQSVVLENLAHLYTHPSIMDVKLGTVLAGPDATPEKQARMEAQAKNSTSWETGIRLTGSQVGHPSSPVISF